MEIAFNWTDARAEYLVGFNGEDLGVEGVRNEGNLVHIQIERLRPATKEDKRWIRSMSGDKWVFIPA